MKINAHWGKNVSYLLIEMKTLNVPQFYNGFCCYFKYICCSFDKVIKLFTLFCLHPLSVQYLYNTSFKFSDGIYKAKIHQSLNSPAHHARCMVCHTNFSFKFLSHDKQPWVCNIPIIAMHLHT
jgi:hypothetical protein